MHTYQILFITTSNIVQLCVAHRVSWIPLHRYQIFLVARHLWLVAVAINLLDHLLLPCVFPTLRMSSLLTWMICWMALLPVSSLSWSAVSVESMTPTRSHRTRRNISTFHSFSFTNNRRQSSKSTRLLQTNNDNNQHDNSLEFAVRNRYACKAFERFDGQQPSRQDASSYPASPANPYIVRHAHDCLDLARQAPSAYNIQPYKLLLIDDVKQKQAMAKYCLGPNKFRVLDSDCTVIFLADRQVLKTLKLYRDFCRQQRESQGKTYNTKVMRKTQLYIAIFSSGYPLPRVLSAIVSFFFRTAMSVLNLFSQFVYPLPTLASAETWAAKQTLLVAMIYLLACSSQQIATIPMEGINASGIRKALKIPSRYAIPLIVSTGTAAKTSTTTTEIQERIESSPSRRYPTDQVIYRNVFGTA